MRRFIVRVYKMEEELERKLMSLGEVEEISRIFYSYLVTTTDKNIEIIKSMKEVISVREEDKGELMPVV